MDRVRIGMIGAGGIASRHLDDLLSFEDVTVAAMSDPDQDRARMLAGRCTAKVYTKVAEMLDAEKLDAVYICVPPFAHGDIEQQVIARGLPFFVEKPLAVGSEIAESIAAQIAEKNLLTAVGYHWRYLDTTEEAHDLLSKNPARMALGYWLDSTPPPAWWRKQSESGGQMVEQTTHIFDLARVLVGDVRRVYAAGSRIQRSGYANADVFDVTTATLHFTSGAVGTMSSTCLLNWPHRIGLHLFGDGLAIELSEHEIMIDSGHGRPVRRAESNPFMREDRAFIDAVQGKANQIRATYADALITHRLTTAATRSAEQETAIDLDVIPTATVKINKAAVIEPLRRPTRDLPPDMRVITSLGVEREGQVYFFSYDEGGLPPGQFRVETLYTGLSAGTELTFYKATNPYLRARWDSEWGVFASGDPSIRLPMPFMGYMEVARVTESRVPGVQVGQVIAATYGHKTGHTLNPVHELYTPLDDDFDPLLGIYVGQMGPICANGLLHAAAALVGRDVRSLGDGVRGRNVLIMGAGVIGLLTGLFALEQGAANVAIADRTPERLEAARGLGLQPINESQIETWQYCKERWHYGANDRGADVVFQCRAQSASLHTALRSLRPQGTVVDLAFYQGGASDVRLGEEFHHNGLTVVCAQIGRVPRGLTDTWPRQRLAAETVSLLRKHSAAVRQHVITDVVPLEQAPEIFNALAERRRVIIQTVFQAAP